MEVQGIYTIGYGNRSIDEFIDMLKKYQIQYLIDVRSKPYSKFKPEYSQKPMESILKANGIRYVFMGDLLGGLPNDAACYTDGKADYDKIEATDFFQSGIYRLETAFDKQLIICLMCSESKPHECHRSKLIGKVLEKKKIEMLHIDENGEIKNQQNVIYLITNGIISLFGDDDNKLNFSRKTYKQEKEFDYDY